MRKTEKMKQALDKAIAFYASTKCYECPLRPNCGNWSGSFVSCTGVFVAAVFAGIIDLDGNLIEGDEQ